MAVLCTDIRNKIQKYILELYESIPDRCGGIRSFNMNLLQKYALELRIFVITDCDQSENI